MLKNEVKEKIKKNELTQGAITSLYSPAVVEMLGYAGYEFIIMDDEHGAYSGAEMEEMIRAARLTGMVPIIRVSYDPSSVQKALDRGALGIQVPMVNSREQAERVVQAAKYPPYGKRGTAFSMRAAGYGFHGGEAFMNASDEQILISVQIETPEAAENFTEIMDVPGIDMAFLGPTDLSVNMGYRNGADHPEVQEVLSGLYREGADMKTPIGTIASSREDVLQAQQKGACFVSLVVTNVMKKAFVNSLAPQQSTS